MDTNQLRKQIEVVKKVLLFYNDSILHAGYGRAFRYKLAGGTTIVYDSY